MIPRILAPIATRRRLEYHLRVAVSLLCRVAVVEMLLLTVGCATPYGPLRLRGGYSESRLDENTFRVEFKANFFTLDDRIENYLQYRCAEVTLASGYDWFIPVKGDAERRAFRTRGTPGQASHTSGPDYMSGDPAWIQQTFPVTFRPSNTILRTQRYGWVATIRIVKGAKPRDLPFLAYDAHDVVRRLAPYVNR